jgi:hypothetical protein
MTDVDDDGDRLLDEFAVAKLTALSVSKVRKLRLTGGGPKFLKLGDYRRACVRYALGDVRSWIAALERRG